ncbi:MAG: phage tail tape measure protein, partial [Clostridia bacterium]|nr:phage tail tape measure protein [Clostridia bacterium]
MGRWRCRFAPGTKAKTRNATRRTRRRPQTLSSRPLCRSNIFPKGRRCSMALKVGELFASFGIKTDGLDSAISGIESKCQGIANSLSGFGKTASLTLTTPITLAAKQIYKAGSEFEAQMSKVGAISGATGADFDALTQKAIEMGSTTAFTSTEAGEALEYMAMAGWKTDQMLSGLQPIMDLAAASGESLGTTSDIVTDALTAFGLTAQDTGHFADVLAAASTNANTNVAMMGESFKYVAPLAGSLGYSVDDVAVALGIMANNGIKGSQAGTSLSRIIQNMVSPTNAQAA